MYARVLFCLCIAAVVGSQVALHAVLLSSAHRQIGMANHDGQRAGNPADDDGGDAGCNMRVEFASCDMAAVDGDGEQPDAG